MAYFRHTPEQDGQEGQASSWVDEEEYYAEDELDYDDDEGNLDDLDEDWQLDLPEEQLLEEKRARRKGKMRIAAGLGDFFGVILGTVCVLVLIALLVSLLNWLQVDVEQNFTLWQNKL